LVYSTYLGGAGGDTEAIGVATDGSGSVYITGGTTSASFPVTAGAFQSQFGGALSQDPNSPFFGNAPGDAFVTKLVPSASGAAQLAYSTYIGGESDDQAGSIAVTRAGLITVAGGTDSLSFPTTPDALQPFPVGNNNLKGFLARIDPSQSGAASVRYLTLLGGTTADILYGVAVDGSGDRVLSGTGIPLHHRVLAPSGGRGAFLRVPRQRLGSLALVELGDRAGIEDHPVRARTAAVASTIEPPRPSSAP
jgi:hypothetical protein